MTQRKSRPIDGSRRHFLQTASALSGLGAGTPLALNLAAMSSAAAQAAPDYKALVCVFLFGGNDQSNTVVPFDADTYQRYYNARTSIALLREQLVSLGPVAAQANRSYALPTQMQPLSSLYASGKAAVVANVGPLVVPTTKTQYRAASVPLPPKLFSHNDQQSLWQAGAPEGAVTGWGGRMADLLASGNSNQGFTAVTVTGAASFLSGPSLLQYQVGTAGPTLINALTGTLFGSTTASSTLRTLVTQARSSMFENEFNAFNSRSINTTGVLKTAIDALPPLATAFPTAGVANVGSQLGSQLQMVARMIAARNALGMKRQVFFVSQGGYDTHDFQLRDQATLHTQLAAALDAFYKATVELGVANQVTTFTASDFGRTLTSNGDGSDHGWGSHHFVIGGAVRGGSIYGTFPDIAMNTNEDLGSGRLLPTTSVDQYAGTLARWFGVADGSLNTIVPNLANFTTRNLGFMA
jgi:uncharacterized protein (DUF1501 family)